MIRRGLIHWFIIYNNITWYMGNNGVTLFYICAAWNLAAARIKRSNAWSFNAISWFRDAALMKGSQNQRAYPHSTWGWGSFLITLGNWFDDEAFGYSIIDSKSLSHVAFLPWRDGASYSQATTTTSLSLSVLTFSSRKEDIHSFDVNMELSVSQRSFQEVTSGSSVPSSGPNVDFLKVVRMVFWSGVVGLARSRLALTVALRAQKLDLWASLVLMVKVERRNWLTIHIPHSRVTDDIRLKNELGA